MSFYNSANIPDGEKTISNKRLDDWSFDFRGYKGLRSLMKEKDKYLKEKLVEFSTAFGMDEEENLLYIPILNLKWAIKKVLGVQEGAFVALNKRFVILDFENLEYHSINYKDIVEVGESETIIPVRLSSGEVIAFEMNFPYYKELEFLRTNFPAATRGEFADDCDCDRQIVEMILSRYSSYIDVKNEIFDMMYFVEDFSKFLIEAAQLKGLTEN